MTRKKEKPTKPFRSSFSGGLSATAITILGIAISLCASSALQKFENGDYYYPSLFILTLIIFGTMIGLREHGLKKSSEIERKKYESKQDELLDILKNYPPTLVFKAFSQAYKEEIRSFRILKEQGKIEKEHINERVRYCLEALLKLFKQYRFNSDGSQYFANIMVYIKKETYEKSEALRKDIEEKIQFIEYPEIPLHRLDGVLYLDKALSATTIPGEELKIDESLEDLVLPIPNKEYEPKGFRSRFLPVAPLAMRDNITYIEDTSILFDDEKIDELEATPALREKVKEFFRKKYRTEIGSVLSIRLDRPWDNDPSNDTPMAVVNIHSNRPNKNLKEEHVEYFVMIARPILERIKDLIIARNSGTVKDSSKES